MVSLSQESTLITNYMLAPGEVAANANMLPNIGPTHGVQHPANAAPNTNEVM